LTDGAGKTQIESIEWRESDVLIGCKTIRIANCVKEKSEIKFTCKLFNVNSN
jgi:hypothetical protein